MTAPTIDGLELGDVDLAEVVATLRRFGAAFALVHGSRVIGDARPDSDVDVAAWLPEDVDPWTVPVPDGIDLLSLRRLSLHVAGRIATHGVLLFDDDPPTRVRWQAETRQRWADDAPRRRQFTEDALRAAAGG
jgi:uncharacterized protein